MERVNKQKQQARSNNKNKARTYLGGSFGSPSSFRYNPPASPPSWLHLARVTSLAFADLLKCPTDHL